MASHACLHDLRIGSFHFHNAWLANPWEILISGHARRVTTPAILLPHWKDPAPPPPHKKREVNKGEGVAKSSGSFSFDVCSWMFWEWFFFITDPSESNPRNSPVATVLSAGAWDGSGPWCEWPNEFFQILGSGIPIKLYLPHRHPGGTHQLIQ